MLIQRSSGQRCPFWNNKCRQRQAHEARITIYLGNDGTIGTSFNDLDFHLLVAVSLNFKNLWLQCPTIFVLIKLDTAQDLLN